MMDSLFSILPKSFFSCNPSTIESTASGDETSLASASPGVVDENTGVAGRKKRPRDECDRTCGSRTPSLVSTRRYPDVRGSRNHHEIEKEASLRPVKRFRGERKVVPISPEVHEKTKDVQPKSLLGLLPDDVMTHCLSFLGSVEDRFSLQCTSKQFRRISNTDELLIGIQVGGDRDTGMHGIIQEHDTPETASEALTPFAQAGNLEAIYMLGIIKSYCHQDVEGGICLLKMAAEQGYVRSSYALGLVLRDSQPDEAAKYMKAAATAGYLPALQELLPAREMKAKYGEPNADELRRHLDPLCLNRLLSRHYVRSADLRDLSTSHCWNPLCGRWAFKATVNSNGLPVRTRRAWGFHFYHRGNGATNTNSRNDNSSTHSSSSGSVSTATPRIANGSSRSTERADVSQNTETNANRSEERNPMDFRVSRMKMCSRCCRAKYCSKLCQVYDWRSGRHKMECQFL